MSRRLLSAARWRPELDLAAHGAALLACVALTACSAGGADHASAQGVPAPSAPASHDPAREVRVVELALSPDAADRDLELSGLAWYGDWLVVLPENLGRGFSLLGGLVDGPQFVFAIARDDIDALLDGRRTEPLQPRRVPVVPQLEDGALARFDGFESIAFDGDTAYLTVETLQDETGYVAGLIVRGEMAADLSALRLDLERTTTIRSQTPRPNASEEALVVLPDGSLLTLYELNGARINPAPVAHVVDPARGEISTRPAPNLEYRVTDATELDGDGRFWVVNYSWPGSGSHDTDENVHPDPLRERHGSGATHARHEQVERLVELRVTEHAVELTDAAPIQLELVGDWAQDMSRNWEGIARLDTRGFLVVTDRFPRTVLAFVPR